MNKLVLNETPLRTSKNFGINNIEINNLEIPQKLSEFENIEISKENCDITSNVSKQPLIYGTGKILEKNVFENANNRIKIVTKKEKEDIKIIYNFDDENTKLVNQIEIEANGEANIIIEYKSETDLKCFHNGIIKTKTAENSKLNIIIVNLLNEESDNFEAIENEIQANAKVNYTIIDIGGNRSISNYYSNILGERAENDLKTIYLGRNDQIKDINYIAELRGEKTNIDIDVQGALKDKSKKNFKGTIDFKRGSKKSKGNENEYCMLLSDKAKSIALPMLLCTEEDIEGNHSTASGKVDEKELFYIMTRGISYKEAIKLIVKAKFNKILERITEEKVKQEIIEEIDRRLD